MRRLGKLIENAIVDRQEKYMRLRIEQLKEDMEKAHDEHDKKWYMSRTLWANVLVFGLAVIDAYNASFGIPAEV